MGHLLPSTLAFFTPAHGASPNAQEHRHAVQDHAVHRARDLRRGRGRARLRARQVPQAQGRGRGADPRQHAPGDRLDGRGGGDPAGAGGADVREALLDPGPAELGPGRRGARRTEQPDLREHLAQTAAQRQSAEHHGDRPPVHLAVRLPRRERTGRPGRAVLVRGTGRADGHDGQPRPRLRGRGALVVGAGTRRQVPGGARLPQLHLVQGRQAGHLPRAVRVPVRTRPRAHDRHRQGRAAGPVRSVAGAPEAADRDRPTPKRRRRARNSRRRPAPERSRTPRTSRRPADDMATYAAPIPEINRPSRGARGERLDQLDHDDRSQADRDHVHGPDVRVLHPRRHRGADDPPAAGRAEQHAGDAGNLQPAVHDARDDDDLPVRRADDGGPRELLPAADDRRARHGLPAPERAVLLAAARRRHRLLRLALLAPAGSRLDELPAAVGRAVLAVAAARTPGST